MRINIIQFDRDVSAGTYGRWLTEWGVDVCAVGPDQQGEPAVEQADALLLLGGHMGVHERDRHPLLKTFHARLPELTAQGLPILAICLGAQLLADALGGRATPGTRGERSMHQLRLTREGERDPLFAGLANPFVSFQWHNDSFDLPTAALHLAYSDACPGQAFRCRNAYGLQFHPEVDESIVRGWCQRAKAGDTPLSEFRARREDYRKASERILRNFMAMLQR